MTPREAKVISDAAREASGQLADFIDERLDGEGFSPLPEDVFGAIAQATEMAEMMTAKLLLSRSRTRVVVGDACPVDPGERAIWELRRKRSKRGMR